MIPYTVSIYQEKIPEKKFRAKIGMKSDEQDISVMSALIEEASSAYASGFMDKSLELYDQLIKIDPTNNISFANRSAIFLKLGKVNESLNDAEEAVRLNFNWAKVDTKDFIQKYFALKGHFRKGEALRDLFKFDQALISYSQALTLDSENERFRVEFFKCLALSSAAGQLFFVI